MRTLLILSILLWGNVFNVYSQEKEKQPNVNSYAGAKAIGELVKKKLPDGWTCTYDHSEVIIKRNNPVLMANVVSIPYGPLEKYAKENGWKSSYLMTLHFVPKLSSKQYNSLMLFKKKQLSKVSPNVAFGKHVEANQVNEQFLVPRYFNSRYSVYLYKTDDASCLKVFPKSVEEETKLVLRIIESLLKKYPNL